MKSTWSEYKNEAVYLREHGLSITYIERKLGIPRSTLSEWFKTVTLTPEQAANLKQRKAESLRKYQQTAQAKAAEQLRKKREAQIQGAQQEAAAAVAEIDASQQAVLDLSLALLYRGGEKDSSVLLTANDPLRLKMVMYVLQSVYNLRPAYIECALRISPHQDDMAVRTYWSEQIGIPIENFTKLTVDKRAANNAASNGSCTLICKNKAIQRKLTYLYNLFCDKVVSENRGD